MNHQKENSNRKISEFFLDNSQNRTDDELLLNAPDPRVENIPNLERPIDAHIESAYRPNSVYRSCHQFYPDDTDDDDVSDDTDQDVDETLPANKIIQIV